LPMGMVNLVARKMSSRTGEILRVDDLLEEVKKLLRPLMKEEKLSAKEEEKILEVATIAAVKYSVLRVDPKNNVVFDVKKSVSLEGDSGVYVEYTYARTQSVLAKSTMSTTGITGTTGNNVGVDQCVDPSSVGAHHDAPVVCDEESILLRTIYRFPEIVTEAAKMYSPSIIAGFLFDLCQKFNSFYDKQRIIGSESESFRLVLTKAVGEVIKNGLRLLGIEALRKM